MVRRIPVEAGQIMGLARALGDTNPAYFGEAGGDSATIVAPPTFTETRYHFDPDSVVRPRFDRPWFGSGKDPSGTPGVHPNLVNFDFENDSDIALPAETHFEYFEPIHPGDVLSMVEKFNNKWQKQTSRAGVVTFFDVIREFRNQRDEVVVTERIVWFVSTRGVEAS